MRRLAILITALTAICLLVATSASAAAPQIEKATFSHLSTDSVRLEAEINPGGKITSYLIEYGPLDCASNPCTIALEGELPPESKPFPLSTEVKGLTLNTSYHFRIIASNSEGEDKEAKAFTTYALPLIDLPDGRAYEQASPVKKNAVDVRGLVEWVKASVNGDAVTFMPTSGMPGAEGAQELIPYLASRGAANWSTQGLLPPATLGSEAFTLGWLPDFSRVYDYGLKRILLGDATLVERTSADHSLRTIVPFGEGLQVPSFAGTSTGGSSVFFESHSKLNSLPASLAGKSNVYAWDRASQALSLASVFNDGSAPKGGAYAGAYDWIRDEDPDVVGVGGPFQGFYTQDVHAISADGSLFFTDADTGQLYLRRNPTKAQSPVGGEGKCEDLAKACTLQVSASKRTPPDPLGAKPAALMSASVDGSVAIFTSSEELTDDANTGPVQDPPTIARADITTEPPSDVKLDCIPATASGVAVNATHIYWANPLSDTIGWAGIDCEDPETFISLPEVKDSKGNLIGSNPQYITLDATHIYWTNAADGKPGTGSIGRAKLGAVAGEVDQEFIKGKNAEGKVIVEDPRGIDVDDKFIYWANTGAEVASFGTIARAGIDGSNPERSFINPSARGAQAVAVNATHIYWTGSNEEGQNNFVVRRDLDGNEASQFSFEKSGKNSDVQGIALDATHVYWARKGGDTIARIPLSLKDEEAELEWIKGAGRPKGIAVDGAHVYWSANGEVLPNPGNDLYRYEAKTGELSDLAPVPASENGIEVKGVLGASADASHVYFAANGVPAAVTNSPNGRSESAAAGNCRGVASGNIGFTGECNLYLAREGEPVHFIARLDAKGGLGSDAANWLPGDLDSQRGRTARVSPDGQTLLFRSQRQLSDYENEGAPMLYRYRLGESAPSCVSCNPTGAAPGAPPAPIGLSGYLPASPTIVLSRSLSASGNQVFFETSDALVATDTNGVDGCPLQGARPSCQDVYEWEAKGSGSCKEDIQGGGCLYLLSTGKSPEPSFFADASASGNDAFIVTRSAGLVLQDQDQLYDLFDVRVGGGLFIQNQVKDDPCRSEVSCRGAAQGPPALESPGTATFSGPPDAKPKRKGGKGKRAHKGKGKGKGKGKKGKGKGKRAAKKSRGTSR